MRILNVRPFLSIRAGADAEIAVERENQLAALDACRVLALLLERVLDLEQVREIATRLETNGQLDRFAGMVENGQLLGEAVADGAPADHRQLRVDVDGPRTRHEEEARLEVLEVVDRERVHSLSVDRQDPLREEAR